MLTYTQYVRKFGKLSSGHRTVKGQFSFQSQRRAMPRNVHTTMQLHLFHMLARYCSKSFKLGLQYMNQELLDVEAGLRTGRGTKDQIANICWIIEKSKRIPGKKKSTSALLTTVKLLIVWITTICGKFLKRWEYQTS